MEKKEILVLTGSPRKDGNSELLAEAFIEGAQKAGHIVTKIRTAEYQVNGCLACERCWADGTHCSQKDDMFKIYPALEKADVLVFATPLYFYSWPSKLKAVLDRTFTYISPDKKADLKIKECVLLVTAETKDVSDLDGLVNSYRIVARFSKWQDRGVLRATGVLGKGEIRKGNWLEQAKKMGFEI